MTSIETAFEKRLLPLLNDRRHLPLLAMAVRASSLLPCAVYLALPGRFSWIAAAAYWSLLLALLPPFVTMYHDSTHSRLFRRRYGWLNTLFDWMVAPLFGFTPETYFVHHIGMHHPEENLAGDISTTLPYQRDSIVDFARYYARFFVSIGELAVYCYRKRRFKLMGRAIVGELTFFAAMAAAFAYDWRVALAVFAVPLFIGRSVLIVGNWGEHAFVDTSAPDDVYRASTNLLGDSMNARCFNVGYHIGHHLRPRAHYTEMARAFEREQAAYGAADALVFRGMHYPTLWLHLMSKNYARLARAYVRLPGAKERSEEEIVAMLRARVARVAPVAQ
jgi:fatty acid desaturase